VSPRRQITLFVDPPSHHFLDDRLFDPAPGRFVGENILAPYLRMRERLEASGVAVHTADRMPPSGQGGQHLYLSLGRTADVRAIARRPDVVASAFFAIECPIVEPSLYRALPGMERAVRRVFTFSKASELIRFTGRPISSTRFVWPQCADGVDSDIWRRTDRRLLCMINGNKLPRLYARELYTARLRAVEYFARFDEIDLYGRDWDRGPWRVGRTRIPYTLRAAWRWGWERRQRIWPDRSYAAARRVWRGAPESKLVTLGAYTFAICFENMVLQGWITEKIFDCFFAGCVPVYWGAPEIGEVVPREAFIDMRAFEGFADLRTFLRGLGPKDVARYREAGRAFVESPAYDPFRPGAFAERVAGIVLEDAGA